MSNSIREVRTLGTLAALAVRGADARTFLQGQLSHDTRKLTSAHALLACANNAQGRVQAVVSLVEHGDAILLVAPPDIVAMLGARLRMFVLRSKVTLAPADELVLVAVNAAEAARWAGEAPLAAGDCAAREDATVLRWWSTEERYLLIAPRAAVAEASPDPALGAAWHRADIAAGLPQVYPQTRESFVAQMLNLDLLNAIAFDKGCYTGQEIIARVHYRGTIKRRMFRFAAALAAPPAPGTPLLNDGSPAGEVVDGCVTGASSSELLAVVSLDRVEGRLTLADGTPLERLGLPYAVPQAAAA